MTDGSNTLTPARLFSDPPLSGINPQDVRFCPDGQSVTYRAAAQNNSQRMDLWRINPEGEHTLWVNAEQILGRPVSGSTAELTAEERAERERRRQFTFGVNQYIWHPRGETLLVPVDGQAYLLSFHADSQELDESRMMCPAGTRQSGFQFSPQGTYLSYVRDGDLYCCAAAAHAPDAAPEGERRLTHDAGNNLVNGLADFLAAEEMHRFSGHWWSEDERFIAYCKVDDSNVQVSHRLELEADGARTVEQRYPYPGCENPQVALHLLDLSSGEDSCVWRSPADDAYLARVCAGPQGFLLLTQDRLQQHLQLCHLPLPGHAAQSGPQVLYREHSATWINLTDDLHVLHNGDILFSSEASGTRRPIVISPQGQVRELAGPQHINRIIDADPGHAYASGWQDSPTENHLFKISLDGSGCEQLTTEPGWHEVSLNQTVDACIDRFSSTTQPPSIYLRGFRNGNSRPRVLFQQQLKPPHPYADFLPSHVTPELGEIEAVDGQRLCYRVTPPANPHGKHATIVYVYGGPGAQKVRHEWPPLLLQLFAQHGFAVLEVDNRGSGNRGREFEAPIYTRLAEVEVADQVRGLQVLDRYPWADRSRVGVFGHSYGGYMSLMCLCRAGSHFAAGAAAAPVCDWRLYDTHYTERYMGLPDDNPGGYADSNVLSHLQGLSAPLLLLHGMADDNVLFTHSTMIMSALQAQGTPFELMTYPGAKHSMQERAVSTHRFNLILDFFRRHLQPH